MVYRCLLRFLTLSVVLLAVAAGSGPARADGDEIILNLLEEPTGVPKWDPIVPNAEWRELYPSYDSLRLQTNYVDNSGDGEIAVGDYLQIDADQWYHIVRVGPVYFLYCNLQLRVCEPTAFDPGNPDPTGTEWFEIHPGYGVLQTVQSWDDNGDGVVGAGDGITLGQLTCSLVYDGLGIHAETVDGPIGSEDETWGGVKSLYR